MRAAAEDRAAFGKSRWRSGLFVGMFIGATLMALALLFTGCRHETPIARRSPAKQQPVVASNEAAKQEEARRELGRWKRLAEVFQGVAEAEQKNTMTALAAADTWKRAANKWEQVAKSNRGLADDCRAVLESQNASGDVTTNTAADAPQPVTQEGRNDINVSAAAAASVWECCASTCAPPTGVVSGVSPLPLYRGNVRFGGEQKEAGNFRWTWLRVDPPPACTAQQLSNADDRMFGCGANVGAPLLRTCRLKRKAQARTATDTTQPLRMAPTHIGTSPRQLRQQRRSDADATSAETQAPSFKKSCVRSELNASPKLSMEVARPIPNGSAGVNCAGRRTEFGSRNGAQIGTQRGNLTP